MKNSFTRNQLLDYAYKVSEESRILFNESRKNFKNENLTEEQRFDASVDQIKALSIRDTICDLLTELMGLSREEIISEFIKRAIEEKKSKADSVVNSELDTH